MDRGAWQATVHVVAESDMTERLTHEELTGKNVRLEEEGGISHFAFVIPWLSFFLFLGGLTLECFFTWWQLNLVCNFLSTHGTSFITPMSPPHQGTSTH